MQHYLVSRIFKVLVVVCIVVLPVGALADRITYSVASKHFNENDLNEKNTGFGYETRYGKYDVQVGKYLNSFEKPTWYVGAGYSEGFTRRVRLGYFMAIGSGYDEETKNLIHGEYLLMFTPYWQYNRGNLGVRVGVSPLFAYSQIMLDF